MIQSPPSPPHRTFRLEKMGYLHTLMKLLLGVLAVEVASSSTVSLSDYNERSCASDTAELESTYCLPLEECLAVPPGIPDENSIGDGVQLYAKLVYHAARLEVGVYLDKSCNFNVVSISDECGIGICCEPEVIM